MTAGSFTLPRAAARDDLLPFDTRGFLAWLASHTARYISDLNEDRIRELTGLGRDHLRRMMRELVDTGYVVRRRLRDARGQLLGAVRYALTLKPDRQTSLPIDAPSDGLAVERSDQPKHDVSAGGPIDGLAVHRSIYREDQEENKEPLALSRADVASPGGRMPRSTKSQIPGQTAAWPAAVPDPGPEIAPMLTADDHDPTDRSWDAVQGKAVEPIKERDLTARWIDHCAANGVALPPMLIKRYAKKIKELRTAGIGQGLITRALHAMLLDAQVSRVALLDNYVVRVQQGPGLAPATMRRSTTDDRVAAALALAAEFAAEATG